MPDDDTSPSGWRSSNKFAAALETASINQAGFINLLSTKGLYPEQPAQWRMTWKQANDWNRARAQQMKAARRTDEQRAGPH